MSTIFDGEIAIISSALKTIDQNDYMRLKENCSQTIKNSGKLVVSGLGKNVPICEKFVGTMTSLGLPAAFMDTNSAVHGDLGLVKNNDLVILLSKSGKTVETVRLYELLAELKVLTWLLTFSQDSALAASMKTKLLVHLAHEGDSWDLVPNNSSVLNLIVLQKLCMDLALEFKIPIEQFRRNHPGGHIGERLKCRKS